MAPLNYKPHIGKNVIETLTLGMYENPFFIYREYVQNAADQIDIAVEQGILSKKDEGKIEININKEEKFISIKDNATGIRSSEVLKFLGDVANSQKDRTKRKGFRGIGRLGGLGYCKKLIFKTSYQGEKEKNIITLNAELLKKIIEDKADTSDAASVISLITNLTKKEVDAESHFFEVILEYVTKEELLEIEKVKEYLSMVAPIPYNKEFTFSKKIYQYFKSKNFKIDEYDIRLTINNNKLYKAYKNNFLDRFNNISSQLIDVDFFEIRNNDEELIALAWYGLSDIINKILPSNNIERGLRLRKENIQIGDENTLNKFFREDRFNHHFVGEIHVIGDSFIPNARRDYFNDTSTLVFFEKELKKELKKLYDIAHYTSNILNRKKEIELYIQEKEKFEKQSFRSEVEKNNFLQIKEKAEKAVKTLSKIKAISKLLEPIKKIYSNIISEDLISKVIEDNKQFIQEISKPSFSKISKEQEKIVLEIFAILENKLPIEKAEEIKQIIIEKYN